MSIRPAQPDDLQALVAVDHVAQVDPARIQFIQRAIADCTCFVAVADGRIVGYCVLEYSFFGCGFISMVMVDAACRRRGIGTALIRHAEAQCKTPKLFTSTNESNQPMRALLGRLGFLPSGKIENLDEGDPELIFFKDVSSGRSVTGAKPPSG